MPELAVIVPSKGRPLNAARLVAAWTRTRAWDYADMVLVIDADDPELDSYRLVVENAPIKPLIVVIPRWMPMVPKLNRAAINILSRYKYLGFQGDDHLPKTVGWARAHIRALERVGTGVAYANDLIQGEKLATACVMTSNLVKALGWFAPPNLSHLYCDNAWMAIGKATSLVYLSEIVIEHKHPMGKTAEWDETYSLANSPENITNDRIEFERWERDDLPGLIDLL